MIGQMIWTLFLAVILRTVADVSLKKSVHNLNFTCMKSTKTNICCLFKNPFLWLGSSLGLLNVFVWSYSLKQFDLSYAYPFLSISYITIMICGWIFFKETLDLYKLIGIGFIFVGTGLLFL